MHYHFLSSARTYRRLASVSIAFLCVSQTFGFGLQKLPSRSFTTATNSLLSSQQTPSKTTDQMFQNYDRPIVMIGASGEGNELTRLAESFHARHVQLDEAMLKVGPETTETGLLASIEDGSLRWPRIVLLDFGQEMTDDDNLENRYSRIAQALHENDLLSVYVNVDSVSSKMDTIVTGRKERLEENVFIKFSDYEICIRDEGHDGDNWEHIEWEFNRVLARARLNSAVPGDTFGRPNNSAHLTMGQNTFFLSLSFPDIRLVEPYVQEMCEDVDAMEYRADLLKCRDNRFDTIYGMQLLRRYCRPHCVRSPALPSGNTVLEDVMPIVYTVRTQNQAGTYPDDESGITRMFQMLKWGLRAGVEVLDVESAWDKDQINSLLKLAQDRYSSQILGSEHVVGRQISTEEAVSLFQQCAFNGRAHGAKLVLSIDNEEHDRMAYEAALIASQLAQSNKRPLIPNISLVLGDVGKFSRVINLPFTPVTHESLPVKAAPGQMTSAEIMTTRLLTNIYNPRRYCILGHNIAYSVSPQMQGAAFAATKLPNEFLRVDVATVEEFVDSGLFKSDDFGGGCVTIPHKQAIVPYVDILSSAAREIGSVNTLIVREEYSEVEGFRRVIHGDNTDWRGIYNPLNRLLGSPRDGSEYALILGAGGTARAAAYVAVKLGLKPIYFNRTPSKAEDLMQSFGGIVISNLGTSGTQEEDLGRLLGRNKGYVAVVISTLPAAANFVMPDWLLQQKSKPIVFDVNYKPYNTKLLLQAEASGCKVVRGSEMLWEQGVGQFELWAERTAPYGVMKQVVLQNCQEVLE
jgi:pentafunctional AROM polypeptide